MSILAHWNTLPQVHFLLLLDFGSYEAKADFLREWCSQCPKEMSRWNQSMALPHLKRDNDALDSDTSGAGPCQLKWPQQLSCIAWFSHLSHPHGIVELNCFEYVQASLHISSELALISIIWYYLGIWFMISIRKVVSFLHRPNFVCKKGQLGRANVCAVLYATQLWSLAAGCYRIFKCGKHCQTGTPGTPNHQDHHDIS